MAQTVIGMFESSSKAQKAVEELVEAGVTRSNIDVSSGSNSGSSYASSGVSGSTDSNESGISKFFKSLFGDSDDDANKYTTVASRAQSIVTVHAKSKDEAETAADILDDNGAVDVDEHATSMGYTSKSSYTGPELTGTTGADVAGLTSAGVGAFSTAGTSDYVDTGVSSNTDDTGKISVIEENLAVGKREVTTGGVRLRSRIVERPVEESIRLREERVNVERNTVDRPATAADFANFQDRDIEMVERAEVPVVSKEARVVEEVSLGKTVEEKSETVSDTVRKTEVDVENLEKSDLKKGYTSTDKGFTSTDSNL